MQSTTFPFLRWFRGPKPKYPRVLFEISNVCHLSFSWNNFAVYQRTIMLILFELVFVHFLNISKGSQHKPNKARFFWPISLLLFLINDCITCCKLKSAILSFGTGVLQTFQPNLPQKAISSRIMGVLNIQEHLRHRRNRDAVENHDFDEWVS